jgi:hypothetical protein
MKELRIFKHKKPSGCAITQLHSLTEAFKVIGRSCNAQSQHT